MDSLYRLKDTLVGFISPGAKRRRTLGPSTPSGLTEHQYLPHSEPRGAKAQAAASLHLVQQNPSTPAPRSFRKRARAEYEDDDEDEEIAISPSDSISQKSSQVGDDCFSDVGSAPTTPVASDGSELVEHESDSGLLEGSEDEEEQVTSDEDEEMLDTEEIFSDEEEEEDVDIGAKEAAEAERRVQEYLARQAELALRKEDVAKVRATGSWDEESLFLYEKLALRSFEPLLHSDWRIDLPTLPEHLFTPDEELAFVNSKCTSSLSGKSLHVLTYYLLTNLLGTKALHSLITLGIRVREMLEVGGNPEKLVARAIKRYLKWSERDGGLTKLIYFPVHAIVYVRSSQTVDSITAAIKSQMKFLGEKHRANLAIPGGQMNEFGELQMYRRPLPVMYGLIVAPVSVPPNVMPHLI